MEVVGRELRSPVFLRLASFEERKRNVFGVRGPEFAPWKVPLGNVVPLVWEAASPMVLPPALRPTDSWRAQGQVPASGPLPPLQGEEAHWPPGHSGKAL